MRVPTPAPAPRSAAVEPPLRLSLGAGVALALEGAVAPDVTPAVVAELGFGFERARPLSPFFALALERGAPTRSETASGIARFQWDAARFSACPLRFPSSGSWAVRPCAFFELGELHAQGEQTEQQQSADVPWRAAGGSVRVEYQLTGPLVLGVEVALVVPFHEEVFYFNPATTAFVAPAVAPAARFGVALRDTR